MPRLYSRLFGFMVAAVLAAACAPVAESALSLSPLSSAGAPSTEVAPPQSENMKIRLTSGDTVLTATLIDRETSRDFVSLLPLTLAMDDLFGREKSGRLPRALSETGPRTRTYEVGDVAYWPPRNSLSIFYLHDGHEIPSRGLIAIGKIDSGVEALNVPRGIVPCRRATS
jgi:hypothetical protein